MAVRDTSREAYEDHQDGGHLSYQQDLLIKAMKPGRDYSRSELAEATEMRLSSVCGRVNELISRKILCEAPSRLCKVTGKRVCPVFRVKR